MSYTAKDLSPLVRGDDWTLKLVITSGGSPIDITNYNYYFTLKDNLDDLDPGALQVTAFSQGPDAVAGILYIHAESTETAGLAPQTYNYDIQQIDNTGNIQTLLLGKVKV